MDSDGDGNIPGRDARLSVTGCAIGIAHGEYATSWAYAVDRNGIGASVHQVGELAGGIDSDGVRLIARCCRGWGRSGQIPAGSNSESRDRIGCTQCGIGGTIGHIGESGDDRAEHAGDRHRGDISPADSPAAIRDAAAVLGWRPGPGQLGDGIGRAIRNRCAEGKGLSGRTGWNRRNKKIVAEIVLQDRADTGSRSGYRAADGVGVHAGHIGIGDRSRCSARWIRNRANLCRRGGLGQDSHIVGTAMCKFGGEGIATRRGSQIVAAVVLQHEAAAGQAADSAAYAVSAY